MSLAVATMVQRVRDLLGDTPWMTRYAGGTTTTADAAYTMPDGTRWDEGAIMEWQDGGAQDWVNAAPTGASVPIYQGVNGTTAVAHTATTYVLRDPAYSYLRITDAINLTMTTLWPTVYKAVDLADMTINNTQTWYDLAADWMAPIRVMQATTGSNNIGVAMYGLHGSGWSVGWAHVPTSLCASGLGMMFPNGTDNITNAIKVRYAAKITSTQAASAYSDLSDGILAEVVAWGAASRILMATDAALSNLEDINMGITAVQSGQRARIGRDFQKTYLDLRSQYGEELLRVEPIMEEQSAPTMSSMPFMSRIYGYS